MGSGTIQEVIAFIAEETGYDASRLTADTRLGEDLGVAGDDGEDLIKAFIQRFGVNMEGFSCERYFGPEAAWNPFTFFIRKLETLTVARLAEATAKGRWQDDGFQSQQSTETTR